eukprot:5653520-Lingulodinium_polyedra.AAC.1
MSFALRSRARTLADTIYDVQDSKPTPVILDNVFAAVQAPKEKSDEDAQRCIDYWKLCETIDVQELLVQEGYSERRVAKGHA